MSETTMGRRDEELKFSIQRVEDKDENAVAEVLRDGNGVGDDDAEGNEDLSLIIVERAILLKESESITDKVEMVTNLKDAEKVTVSKDDFSREKVNAEKVTDSKDDFSQEKVKKKVKKGESMEMEIDLVSSVKVDLFAAEEEANQAVKTEDVVDIIDNVVQISPVENHVLQKLLRRPRYFDPPENGWGTCYNCGEEDHMTVHCTSARRKKPCFVCGSLDHNAKQCCSSKGRNCYNCKKHSHLAKDCPEKNKGTYQNSKLCLKCGEYGHDMFSCSCNYCLDDLKEIQCYVCGNFGHLCCKDYPDFGPKGVSCYRCGFSGHTGLVCRGSNQVSPAKKKSVKSKPRRDNSEVSPPSPNNLGKGRKKRKANYEERLLVCRRSTTTVSGSVISCFKCGEEGHFKSECCNSKAVKLNNQVSTPKQKSVKLLGDDSEVTPSPSNNKNFRKGRKERKAEYEERLLVCRRSTTGSGSVISCFKCGEEGHFKSECSNSKAVKWNNQVSTANQKSVKLLRDESEVTPSPSNKNFGKGRKERKADYEERLLPSSKSKHRHGWTSEHPGDVRNRNGRIAGLVPPATPLPYNNGVKWGSPATPFYSNGDSEVAPSPSTNNFGKRHEKRKANNEERLLPSSKSKHRHGWTSEHPGDVHNSNGRTAGWVHPAAPPPYNNGVNWGSPATPFYNKGVGWWGYPAIPCNNSGVGWWGSPAAPYDNGIGGWGSPAPPYDNYAASGHGSASYPANGTGNFGNTSSNGYHSGHSASQFRNYNGGGSGRHYRR